MLNILALNFFFDYSYVFYVYFIKIPLWNFFVYFIRFSFVAFYRELTLWNLVMFIKRCFDYYIGTIYYSYTFRNFYWINRRSLFWLVKFKIDIISFRILGFVWNKIIRIDFPEKIDMLVSLYIYVLSLDILYDSSLNVTDSFFNLHNFDLKLFNDEIDLSIFIIDLLFLVSNCICFLYTDFYFLKKT